MGDTLSGPPIVSQSHLVTAGCWRGFHKCQGRHPLARQTVKALNAVVPNTALGNGGRFEKGLRQNKTRLVNPKRPPQTSPYTTTSRGSIRISPGSIGECLVANSGSTQARQAKRTRWASMSMPCLAVMEYCGNGLSFGSTHRDSVLMTNFLGPQELLHR